jgi:CDP-4-dehydro-6-deoxyglucose reductase, E1
MMQDVDNLNWPLMKGNFAREDLDAAIALLQQDDPILTQSREVAALEEEWSAWLGVRHSVFVSSGSAANLITMAALREMCEPGEVIVPTITWVSDIVSVLAAGFEPVFVDIDPTTLGMDTDRVLDAVADRTRAVFLTHVLGYNALTDELLEGLAERGVPLIEDACESHGATFHGEKVGTFGLASNFSFYYAHHMTTGEGGMVSTDDPELYDMLRMFRAHGMVREARSQGIKDRYAAESDDLTPDFIFAYPGYNVRSTEIAATMGRSQLRRLDANNVTRSENLAAFLDQLDGDRYRTEFRTEGSSNYAFTLVLRQPDPVLYEAVTSALRAHGVEYRRGLSGGGNQMRQPYLRKALGDLNFARYPHTEHVHFYGFYIGNYPGLERDKIDRLCGILNALPTGEHVKAGNA